MVISTTDSALLLRLFLVGPQTISKIDHQAQRSTPSMRLIAEGLAMASEGDGGLRLEITARGREVVREALGYWPKARMN